MVDRVVLDKKILQAELSTEAMAMQERGEAGVRSDVGFAVEIDRQQFAITPKIVRPLLDHGSRDSGANLRVVVGDFERAEAGLADMQRAYRVLLPALATFQIRDVKHRVLLTRFIRAVARASCHLCRWSLPDLI